MVATPGRKGSKREMLEAELVDRIENLSPKICEFYQERPTEVLSSSPYRHQVADPTNNHEERELRWLVLWRKRSFEKRSERVDRFVERILTVTQTMRERA